MSQAATAMPHSALHNPGMDGASPTRQKKKATLQSLTGSEGFEGGDPVPPISGPPASRSPKKPTMDAKKVLKRRQKGRLRNCDVLGDMGDFETELVATLPPPPPPPPPPSKDTYNLALLPPDVLEAVMIAPDGGTALIEVFESIKAERAAMTEKMNTMTMARMGTVSGSDAFGTQTMSNRYPVNHPSGKVMETSELRSLKKWQEQQKVWQAQESKLAEATGKPPQALAMSRQRLQEYREKREMIDRFSKAVPLDQRGLGEKQWYLSLRDGWMRYVQAGNIFSGLFTAVVERPAEMNRDKIQHIKRLDLDRPGTPLAALSTKAKLETLRDRTTMARGRAWADGNYLKYRTWLYRNNMSVLAPVLPEHDDLVVKGTGMENIMMEKIYEDINLETVETRLKIANPEAFEALQAARESEERRMQAEEEERRAALMALAQAEHGQPREAPAMFLSEQRLVLVAEAGEVGRAALRVENNGCCALYYTWSGAMQQLPKHARGGKAYEEEKFYLSDQSGVILPREVKHFIFTFKSDEPGIFQSTWSVETHPKLEEPVEPVLLRGISTIRDTKQLARRIQHADMVARVKDQEVGVAMERIVRGIATPPRKPEPEMSAEHQAQMNLFMAKNSGLDCPTMYFHAETFSGFADLYKEAHLILHPVLSEEELAAKAKSKDKGADAEPDPFASEEWDGSVEQIKAILAAAASAAEAAGEVEEADLEAVAASKARVAQMQAHCEELVDSTKVPGSRKDIVTSVLREAAYRMAFAVVDQYAEAREDAAAREDERVEEERAEEEEAGRKPPPKKEYPPGEEPYDAEELMEILEEYALPETTKALRRFGKNVRRKAGEIATHLDSKIEAANALQDNSADATWHKFALLRTRKGLLLPGGAEKRQQVGAPEEAESEDEAEEAEGDATEELAEALAQGNEAEEESDGGQ